MSKFAIKQVLVILTSLLFCNIAVARWQVNEQKDSMTDEVSRTAYVTNGEGHSLSIYRHQVGSVWMTFSLADKTLDQISSQKAPIYRIDKNPPQDLEQTKGMRALMLKMDFYSREPKKVRFIIWHGVEKEGRSQSLKELMQGSRVVFRYYLSAGGFKETSFELAGAGLAIAKTLGITQEFDAKVEAQKQTFTNEFASAIQVCMSDLKNFPICNQTLTSCRMLAGDDAQKFRICLENAEQVHDHKGQGVINKQ